MRHEHDRLPAYRDDELTPAERRAVAEHLAGCPACRDELAARQRQSQAVAARLLTLEPPRVPSAEQALARFRAETLAARPALLDTLRRYFAMLLTEKQRPLAIGLTALVCLAILFSFAPVRDAAADFLGLFRVRKFAVIPLDPEQTGRLETLLKQADTGAFGEPQITRPAGPEWAATDASQASTLASYTVRTPGRLPAGTVLEKLTVQRGPAMHYEIDRAVLEVALRAAGARTDGLPQTEKLAFDVDVASTVMQIYRVGQGRLELAQVPSPAIDLPEGINPVALAETAFLFLGMPADDARRLAVTIDWTSTLVIPLPSQAAQAREVSVDGVTGLLLEEIDSSYKNNALLWERDGILYFLNGSSIDQKLLLDVADSLR